MGQCSGYLPMCNKLSQTVVSNNYFILLMGFVGQEFQMGTAEMAPQYLGPQLEYSKAGVDSVAGVCNLLRPSSFTCPVVSGGCWWDHIQAIG